VKAAIFFVPVLAVSVFFLIRAELLKRRLQIYGCQLFWGIKMQRNGDWKMMGLMDDPGNIQVKEEKRRL
jgi:hypothetical protein